MDKSAAAYSKEIASHYKAYRPELHSILLKKCLQADSFQRGLDVGSGVGHSSIALTSYCKEVIGLEPSAFMLQQAHQHPQIRYESFYTQVSKPYDLLCFFGVLFHINDKELNQYLLGLSQTGRVIVADFKIDYSYAIDLLQLNVQKLNYEHISDKNRFNQEFSLLKSDVFLTPFQCTILELLHLMITEPHINTALIQRFNTTEFSQLRAELSKIMADELIELKAELNYLYFERH